MSKLVWDAPGERIFETGIDRGVFYPINKPGVPWNGLTRVSEAPTGGTITPYYYDGVKYAQESEPEEYQATVTAYTYPDEFEESNGLDFDDYGLGYAHQPRTAFNFSYRTLVGNDLESTAFGYKIHLIYNAMAEPTVSDNVTLGSTVDPSDFSWIFKAIPRAIPGKRPTSHLVLDSTKSGIDLMQVVEKILYGTSSTNPRFPSPAELSELFATTKLLKVVPNQLTGVADLISSTSPDLIGDPETGLYSATTKSRLTPTGKPGLYKLEQ